MTLSGAEMYVRGIAPLFIVDATHEYSRGSIVYVDLLMQKVCVSVGLTKHVIHDFSACAGVVGLDAVCVNCHAWERNHPIVNGRGKCLYDAVYFKNWRGDTWMSVR